MENARFLHARKIPRIYLVIRKITEKQPTQNDKVHSVFIAVSHRRKVRYLNTGVKIREDQWEKDHVINHPASVEINLQLSDMIQNLHSFIYLNNLFDLYPQEILDRYNTCREERATSFTIYARQIADGMLKAGKYSTGTSLHTMLKALEKHRIKIMSFSDVTFQKLTEIQGRWTESGLKVNTQGIYFRNMRLVYYRAVNEGLVSVDRNPFRQFTIPRQKTKKRYLEAHEVAKLAALSLTGSRAMIRDMFMLSFYMTGLNYKDLLLASTDQISGGRFFCHRAKTGNPISIRIEPEAQKIIDKYRGEELMLNIVERIRTDPGRIQPPFMDIIQRSNRVLKKLAALVGIDAPLSTYYARHTWATLAARNGISSDIIGVALGHTMDKMADVYIHWDLSAVDRANRVVIDAVK